MKQEITQDYLKSILHYDQETGLFRWVNSSRHGFNGRIAGSLDKDYFKIRILNKGYLSHRLAWLYVYGYFPEYVDHINRVTTDNRICNLREATLSENCMNQTIKTNNTSGVKGVFFCNTHRKWKSQITINKKQISLGSFNNIEDAKKVINEARIKYHGEFANHGEFKQ